MFFMLAVHENYIATTLHFNESIVQKNAQCTLVDKLFLPDLQQEIYGGKINYVTRRLLTQ